MAHYTKRETKEWARDKTRSHRSAAITPLLPDGEIAAAWLQRNTQHWLKIGGEGNSITWLTGEFWSLKTRARRGGSI